MEESGQEVHAEVSYLNGAKVKYGTPGSVRADVVVGDIEHPSVIYDLKTGTAKMTAQQLKNYMTNLPASVKQIIIIRPK